MRAQLYILRSHAAPFVFSFMTLMFIFLLQFLMKAVDQLVGKGLSAWIIGELIVLSLAWMVALAVPASVLVATLMAFGKLSSTNEITALRAGGMSLPRMMGGVLAVAAVLTLLVVEFNNSVLPEANHRFKLLMMDIRRIKPTLSITAGLFNQDIDGYTIFARRTFEHTNDLEGVTIYDYSDPSTHVVITAASGKVSFTPDFSRLILDLREGEIHRLSPSRPAEYRRIRFASHRIAMQAEGFDFERSSEEAFTRGDRELSAADMRSIVDSLNREVGRVRERAYGRPLLEPEQAGVDPSAAVRVGGPFAGDRAGDSVAAARAAERAAFRIDARLSRIHDEKSTIGALHSQANTYLVEIHKKYSIPAACLIFVLIGAPLGTAVRRGTFGVAATLSLGFFLLYWASLIGGEKLGDRGFVPPWLGMWGANIVLGILGLFLTIRFSREVPSLTFLDRAGERVRKLLRLVPHGSTGRSAGDGA
jgi:lipopolysaccharide export system permease protein